MEICTKAEARAAGSRYYFTGVACKRGHVAVRFLCGSCTACSAVKSKAWYSDKPKGATKMRKWRAENAEQDRAIRIAWHAAHPGKSAEYSKRYYDKAPEERRDICRRWYRKNIEAERSRSLKYSKENPEQRATVARNRRAKVRSSGGHTRHDVADLLKMQRGRCGYCRIRLSDKYHVDHIQPLARGGSNSRRNLQILCQPCNQSKHARDPIVFAQSLGMLL